MRKENTEIDPNTYSNSVKIQGTFQNGIENMDFIVICDEKVKHLKKIWIPIMHQNKLKRDKRSKCKK